MGISGSRPLRKLKQTQQGAEGLSEDSSWEAPLWRSLSSDHWQDLVSLELLHWRPLFFATGASCQGSSQCSSWLPSDRKRRRESKTEAIVFMSSQSKSYRLLHIVCREQATGPACTQIKASLNRCQYQEAHLERQLTSENTQWHILFLKGGVEERESQTNRYKIILIPCYLCFKVT